MLFYPSKSSCTRLFVQFGATISPLFYAERYCPNPCTLRSGSISRIEPIAINRSIRILTALQEHYGKGRCRKLKGIAPVRLDDGRIRLAEVHWVEAHGIGKKKMRIKRYLD